MNEDVHRANREGGKDYIIREKIKNPEAKKRPICSLGPNFCIAKTGLIYNHSSKRYQELIHSIATQSVAESGMTLERKKRNEK